MPRLLTTTAIAVSAFATAATAGGIERNAPSTRVLFEEGRYLEFSFSSVQPDLSGSGGTVPPAFGGPLPATGAGGTGDLLDSYISLGFAYKADINEQLSYAVIIDDPVGVDTAYPAVAGSVYSGTTANLDGTAVSAIATYDVSPNVKVYGGLRFQTISAEANLPFIGAALGGYSVTADADWSTGWMVGAAYQRPEIGLRVALTYYSAIDHELPTQENVGAALALTDSVAISTPESVNLEFQTGIAEDTLLFGSVRWVKWSDFVIAPTLFASPAVTGQPLVAYQEDWTTYTLGLGRRFSENWSAAVQVSHEPAADYVPLTTLGPIDGRTSYGVAATYTMDNIKITGGISYVTLGETANFAATQFADGDALGFGLRFGYSF